MSEDAEQTVTVQALTLMPEIQSSLNVPKNNEVKSGDRVLYSYRSAEDILEALKPVLLEHNAFIVVEDDIPVIVGKKTYIRSTATITFMDGSIAKASAQAAEPEKAHGMNEAQITGSTCSYSRKYALSALLGLSDSKDADEMEPPKKIGEEQVREIYELMEELTEEEAEGFNVFVHDQTGADCIEDITLDNVNKMVGALKKKIKMKREAAEQ